MTAPTPAVAKDARDNFPAWMRQPQLPVRAQLVQLIIGLEGEELEDLMTTSNPRFWEAIEPRRKASNTFSADEMRRRLGVAKKRRSRRKQ